MDDLPQWGIAGARLAAHSGGRVKVAMGMEGVTYRRMVDGRPFYGVAEIGPDVWGVLDGRLCDVGGFDAATVVRDGVWGGSEVVFDRFSDTFRDVWDYYQRFFLVTGRWGAGVVFVRLEGVLVGRLCEWVRSGFGLFLEADPVFH